MSKDSIIIYKDWWQAISPLNDAERLKVYDAIMAYSFEGKQPDNLSDVAAMAMRFILPQLQRDVEKYNKIVERNQRNGAKGGRPTKSKNPKKPVGNVGNPKNPVATDDNVNDNVNYTVNDNGVVVMTTPIHSQDTVYINELLQDKSWQEMICMKYHLSIDDLLSYLNEFKENVELDLSNHRDRADFRNHVRNWLNKRIELASKGNAATTNVNDLWKD